MGGSDEPEDKERDAEEEKLRQEAIKRAEEERRVKHKKFEDEREGIRQGIRDKVSQSGACTGGEGRNGNTMYVIRKGRVNSDFSLIFEMGERTPHDRFSLPAFRYQKRGSERERHVGRGRSSF